MQHLEALLQTCRKDLRRAALKAANGYVSLFT
jgi:hypothetical protein